MLKIVKTVCFFVCFALLMGTLCSCTSDKKETGSSSDKITSDASVDNSSSETSSKEEVDTRYRATREKKPDGFKYKNVNIMCIGDSITQGVYFPGGYRYHLYEYLYKNGATFSMVGLEKTTTDPRLPERYSGHSGWGGYKINQITEIAPKLADIDCDIYTIMIGINDYLGGDDTANAPDRYRKLIDKILENKPNAIIFCCSMCPTADQAASGQQYQLNTDLPKICDEYKSKGKNVYHIDTFAAQGWKDGDCFYEGDTVHPNEKGNSIIGQTIGDAILDTVLEINDKGDNSAKQPTKVSGIKVSKNEITLEALEAKTVTATVSPSNAEVDTVLWTSSDENVVTVSNSGKIKGLKKGTATVTATTLDGRYKQEIAVTVNAAEKVTYTEIFKDYFSNRDIWQGDTDIVNNGISTWFPGEPKTITTNDTFNAGNNFVLSMTYAVNNNTHIAYPNNFTSLSYGGFTVKIYDCVKKIELYKDDRLIGEYKNVGLNPERNVYQLVYKNSTATVIFGGEKVISAKASAPSATNIQIVTDERGRCISGTNVILKKAN